MWNGTPPPHEVQESPLLLSSPVLVFPLQAHLFFLSTEDAVGVGGTLEQGMGCPASPALEPLKPQCGQLGWG